MAKFKLFIKIIIFYFSLSWNDLATQLLEKHYFNSLTNPNYKNYFEL